MNTSSFNWLGKPKAEHLYVACSGGVDSMVLALSLAQTIPITVAFYHHGNDIALQEEKAVEAMCRRYGLPMISTRCRAAKPPGQSDEQFWRECRYQWFRTLSGTVVTGHTLDDAVEWYLFSSLHGEGRVIDYRHSNVVRPFLLTPKKKIVAWANEYGLQWFEDPTNADPEFAARNKIRLELLPVALQLNPGLYKVVAKKVYDRYVAQGNLDDAENKV